MVGVEVVVSGTVVVTGFVSEDEVLALPNLLCISSANAPAKTAKDPKSVGRASLGVFHDATPGAIASDPTPKPS